MKPVLLFSLFYFVICLLLTGCSINPADTTEVTDAAVYDLIDNSGPNTYVDKSKVQFVLDKLFSGGYASSSQNTNLTAAHTTKARAACRQHHSPPHTSLASSAQSCSISSYHIIRLGICPDCPTISTPFTIANTLNTPTITCIKAFSICASTF